MLQLRFVGIEKPPVWLVEETYSIGSGTGCHIYLADVSVASRHAQLSVRDEKVTLTPVAENALTVVNGSRVSGPTPLAHDTDVQIGDCHLRIVDPKRERPIISRPEPSTISSWVLQSKTTALANKLFPVEKDMIVGRARECDLCLAVAHLSRRHARLFFDAGALWVEDLASANGTFLNGQRVNRARLRAGDELAFDTLVFMVRGEGVTAHEPVDDKTSLRPALSADIAVPKTLLREAEVSRQSPEPAKPQRPALESSGGAKAPGVQNAVFLWAGVAAVLVLTVLAIFYFAA